MAVGTTRLKLLKRPPIKKHCKLVSSGQNQNRQVLTGQVLPLGRLKKVVTLRRRSRRPVGMQLNAGNWLSLCTRGSNEWGQTYVGTYDGERPDHYGFTFPNAIESGQLDNRVILANQRIQLRWSEDGEQSAPFQVVEAATMDNQHGFLTTYFFAYTISNQ